MGTKMERPGVGLSTIIIKNGKVLLGKRKSSHGKGAWGFPGGKLELFENFETCLTREVKEETNLNIKLIDENPSAITNDLYLNENMHYVTLFFRANYIDGTPQIIEPDECEQWKWFAWDKLPSPLFLPILNLIKQDYNPFK